MLAPFWSDVDNTLGNGEINYEVHTMASGNTGSRSLLEQVSDFVYNYTGNDFSGTWMLVAEWKGVHQYPAEENLDEVSLAGKCITKHII